MDGNSNDDDNVECLLPVLLKTIDLSGKEVRTASFRSLFLVFIPKDGSYLRNLGKDFWFDLHVALHLNAVIAGATREGL